ncbi:hypothetical protein [Oscillibacter sp.]|uniref:hypothetical protein n=1 Tax=Oscillibacter sp. TaxID=1945593 RepID=UPI0025909DB0|nr:hypothetical protein [Oscillibacter sp.]
MTVEELKSKVINAQAKVNKRDAILKKHREQLAKMIDKGADEFDVRMKRSDIEGAGKKLDEAREALKNWEEKLGARIDRDAYIEANAPQIIKDFLNGWKAKAIEYYRNNCLSYIKLREELRKQVLDARREALRTLPELERAREIYKDRDLDEYTLINLWPRKPVDDFLERRGLSRKEINARLATVGDSITLRLVGIRDEQEREAWLEKTIEEEKTAKLVDLIARINSVVGTITDASGLYISGKGDINGIIAGTEGKAKVETITAGGYNIQCLHYRTLIHEFK